MHDHRYVNFDFEWFKLKVHRQWPICASVNNFRFTAEFLLGWPFVEIYRIRMTQAIRVLLKLYQKQGTYICTPWSPFNSGIYQSRFFTISAVFHTSFISMVSLHYKQLFLVSIVSHIFEVWRVVFFHEFAGS